MSLCVNVGYYIVLLQPVVKHFEVSSIWIYNKRDIFRCTPFRSSVSSIAQRTVKLNLHNSVNNSLMTLFCCKNNVQLELWETSRGGGEGHSQY